MAAERELVEVRKSGFVAWLHKFIDPATSLSEILFGLKIEDKRALANVDASFKIPGIAFAEWGPGDMGLSLGFPMSPNVSRRLSNACLSTPVNS